MASQCFNSFHYQLLVTVAGVLVAIPGAQAADLPTGGQIVSGAGNISQSGTTMTVQQNSSKLVATWDSFSIGAGHTLNFVQPSANAVALNKVLGSDVSVIQGSINANGQVFLVNPNGVLFTPNSQVNVGGLAVSTQTISTQDFLSGKYRFSGNSTGSVTNQGDIKAAEGGTVALIAATIVNTGSIEARQGNVLIGAGNTVTLDMGGPVKLTVEEGALNTLIEQGGAIKADGGMVLLTAKAAGDLAASVINHSGVTEAQTLSTGKKGEILLLGDMKTGVANVDGAFDASAPNGGDGGHVETSAAKVQTASSLKVNAGAAHGKNGSWLIDPYNYTITGAEVTNILLALNNNTDVTIDTTVDDAGNGSSGTNTDPGNIEVQNSIQKTGGNDATLTLKANRNITIDDGVTISSNNHKLNLVLWADSDAASGGSIWLNGNSTGITIDTNGGYFTAGGGAVLATGYAKGRAPTDGTETGNGIIFDNVTLTTQGGNIIMRGAGADTSSGGGVHYVSADGNISDSVNGIRLHGNNIINAGTGTISMTALGVSNSGDATAINTGGLGHSRILSAATSGTAITLNGDATGAVTTGSSFGVLIDGNDTHGTLIAATGGGDIAITGKGGTPSFFSLNNGSGVQLEPGSFVLANSGAISFTGTKGDDSSYADVVLGGTVGFSATLPGGYSLASPVTASTTNITVNANGFSTSTQLNTGDVTNSAIQSSGTFTFLPRTNTYGIYISDVDPSLANTLFIRTVDMFQNGSTFGIFKPGFSNFIFGETTNTGAITLDKYTFDNNTVLNTKNNTTLGDVTIGNSKTLSIENTNTTAHTITDSGNVSVSGLKIFAQYNDVTLDNTANTIGTVSANTNSFTMVSGQVLALGTVAGQSGVITEGKINIATTSGDITISQDVTAGSTADDAIIINAGRGESAGTATGGNIIISGSPTIGSNYGYATSGRTSLFSGGASGSTGLSSLVGTSFIRYNSDNTTASFSPALGTGVYAIYREAAPVTTGGNGDSATATGRANQITSHDQTSQVVKVVDATQSDTANTASASPVVPTQPIIPAYTVPMEGLLFWGNAINSGVISPEKALIEIGRGMLLSNNGSTPSMDEVKAVQDAYKTALQNIGLVFPTSYTPLPQTLSRDILQNSTNTDTAKMYVALTTNISPEFGAAVKDLLIKAGKLPADPVVATTPGATVTLPTLMSVKTQKIIGLLGAVTAEMAESMSGSFGSGSPAPSTTTATTSSNTIPAAVTTPSASASTSQSNSVQSSVTTPAASDQSSTLTSALISSPTPSRISMGSMSMPPSDAVSLNKQGGSFTNSNYSGNTLADPNIAGSNFTGADLSGAKIMGGNMGGTNFTNANLKGATLGVGYSSGTGGNFAGTNFNGANLQGITVVAGANMAGATFVGADLRNVSAETIATLKANKANLTGAILTDADYATANSGKPNQ